jgi:hypothetical protein
MAGARDSHRQIDHPRILLAMRGINNRPNFSATITHRSQHEPGNLGHYALPGAILAFT